MLFNKVLNENTLRDGHDDGSVGYSPGGSNLVCCPHSGGSSNEEEEKEETSGQVINLIFYSNNIYCNSIRNNFDLFLLII